jgi:hypothetical protein
MIELLFVGVLHALLALIGRGVTPPSNSPADELPPGLLHDVAAGVVVLREVGRGYADSLERLAAPHA